MEMVGCGRRERREDGSVGEKRKMKMKDIMIIHQDYISREYIAVDVDANLPYHIWEDGGNMFNNHTMQITWEAVEQLDQKRFSGICESNWKKYMDTH